MGTGMMVVTKTTATIACPTSAQNVCVFAPSLGMQHTHARLLAKGFLGTRNRFRFNVCPTGACLERLPIFVCEFFGKRKHYHSTDDVWIFVFFRLRLWMGLLGTRIRLVATGSHCGSLFLLVCLRAYVLFCLTSTCLVSFSILCCQQWLVLLSLSPQYAIMHGCCCY